MLTPPYSREEKWTLIGYWLFETAVAALLALVGALVFYALVPSLVDLYEQLFPGWESWADRDVPPMRELQATGGMLAALTVAVVAAAIATGLAALRTPLSRRGIRTACLLAPPLGLHLVFGLRAEPWLAPEVALLGCGVAFGGYVVGATLSRGRERGLSERHPERSTIRAIGGGTGKS